MPTQTACFDIFERCVTAIHDGELITLESDNDKEFHFQDWVEQRLKTLAVHFDSPKRNSYPDFKLVELAEGYEVKGLKYPGRDKDFDSNSQAPSGLHNGRTVFYIFGRYPKKSKSYPKNTNGFRQYPVIDLVICHGDFFNIDHDYVHKNTHVKGFGSYGDIMIRDRKMYVVPTPFSLTNGTTGLQTLILPAHYSADDKFKPVGRLLRKEVGERVVSYDFDLTSNIIKSHQEINKNAGIEHEFIAYRLKWQSDKQVEMINFTPKSQKKNIKTKEVKSDS